MRKSQLSITIKCGLDKEAALMQKIVTFVQNEKTAGNIDNATIMTQEIEVPTHVEI